MPQTLLEAPPQANDPNGTPLYVALEPRVHEGLKREIESPTQPIVPLRKVTEAAVVSGGLSRVAATHGRHASWVPSTANNVTVGNLRNQYQLDHPGHSLAAQPGSHHANE